MRSFDWLLIAAYAFVPLGTVYLELARVFRESLGSVLPALKNRGQNVLNTDQLQQAMSGDYLDSRRTVRRFARTLLRLLVKGFLVLAASNSWRMPCSNSPTAFSKAPSRSARTIAMDGCRSNDGGRNTFTMSIE